MVFFRVLWTSNGSLGEDYNCQIWIFFPSSLGIRDDKIVHGVMPAWKGWLSCTPAVGAGRLTADVLLSLLSSKSMPQYNLQICSKTTFPHPRPISRNSPRTSPLPSSLFILLSQTPTSAGTLWENSSQAIQRSKWASKVVRQASDIHSSCSPPKTISQTHPQSWSRLPVLWSLLTLLPYHQWTKQNIAEHSAFLLQTTPPP